MYNTEKSNLVYKSQWLQVYEDRLGTKIIISLSKTALEALAGGLKVLTYNLQYIEELPRVNEPEYAVDRVLDIYQM